MKIAILTILDNWENYGSVLQMLALKNWLTMSGNEVCFVKPPKRLDMIQRDINSYVGYKVDKKKNLYIFRKLYKYMRTPFYIGKIVIVQTYNRIRYRKLFRRVSVEKIKDVDLVIVGSDTLWDLNNPAFKDSFYWGKDILDYGAPVVTYAVSSDNLEELNIIKYPWLLECISKFQHISVRDYHTQKIVSKLYTKDIPVVCDPTLLCPETLEIKSVNIKKEYILIYAFELDENEIECIRQFAKQENLLIVCAMGLSRYNFADINLDCGFNGFSGIVRCASYVYTSTFHGCMFSIIHNKNTIYKVQNNKVKDLIDRFGLSHRVFYDHISPQQFRNMMKEKVDIDRLNKVKKSFRLESEKYLKNILDEVRSGNEK